MESSLPEEQLKIKAKARGFDLIIRGRYQDPTKFGEEGGWKVKGLRAIILDKELEETLESAQPINSLYEFGLQQSNITVVDEVSDVIEYISGIAVNNELLKRAKDATPNRRSDLLISYANEYGKLMKDLGYISISEFYKGNGLYREALVSKNPLAFLRKANIAYRNSEMEWEGENHPAPFKQNLLKVSLNRGLTMRRICSNSDNQRDVDEGIDVYRKVCGKYKESYQAFRDRTFFLLDIIQQEYHDGKYRMSKVQFNNICDEYINAANQLIDINYADQERHKDELQKERESIQTEIQDVKYYAKNITTKSKP